jgi:alkylhydroperoxidase family enzyme
LRALAGWRESEAFGARERAALAFADALARDNTVADEVFAEVRRWFTGDEIVELTAAIVWEVAVAKFNRALEIEGQGICFVP